ncbi:hypothetical protein [Aurantiacibacter suaedae]|uniref:hypothetical protein n=1 Tax=Aurantiacibacter suaedae TaxID=2545755 RepID=UPI0010F4C694|nr:hypothetical protein [Aurantiacibacter suaedae]
MFANFRDGFQLRKFAFGGLVKISCVVLLSAGAALASPAAGHDIPTTRLVTCGEHSCLRIEGHRDSVGTMVAINGQPMAVDGGESWRVTLPMHMVRQIAGDGARRLEVTLRHPSASRESRNYARLPIGLLGDTTELEVIRVTAS